MLLYRSRLFRIIMNILMLCMVIQGCTGKDCGYENYPIIEIEIIGVDSNLDKYVVIYNNTNHNRIDSFPLKGNKLILDHNTFDLKNENYHIYSNGDIDIVSNINYYIYEFYNQCNSGFFKNKGRDAIDFSNLEFQLNGIIHQNSEQVKIYK